MKIVVLIFLCGAWLVPAVAQGEPLVPLHPDLPDTLNAGQILNLSLFPDLTGVQKVWFEREGWGGLTAHLQLRHHFLVRNLERSVPREQWARMQKSAATLVAGRLPEPSAGFTAEDLAREKNPPRRVVVWPEVPARDRKLPPGLVTSPGSKYPALKGRWLVSGGVGYQHNVSTFGAYFSDMAVFHLGFAHGWTRTVVPWVDFSVGLGDLPRKYEDLVGDGRSGNYSAMAGIIVRGVLDQRTSVYAAFRSGYFRRSRQWGGLYTDPETAERLDGFALESGGGGFAAQLGLWRQKSHSRKARFFDLNLGVMWAGADSLHDAGPDFELSAQGHDTWLMLTFKFWDQI